MKVELNENGLYAKFKEFDSNAPKDSVMVIYSGFGWVSLMTEAEDPTQAVTFTRKEDVIEIANKLIEYANKLKD